MRYYIISGEASGDLHGSNLIREIKKLDPAAAIRGWGGDLMQSAGMDLVKHYRDLAFMGFVEVVANLPTILGNMRLCKKDILSFKPDVIIFIDYPGFNIPIAKFAKQQGFKTVYYISPQVWAWKEGRVKTIRKVIDKMLVILPFEEEFYQRWDYPVTYVGHPLIEVIDKFKKDFVLTAGRKKTIALLPGSRKQEVAKKLPIMLSVSPFFPDYRFAIAQAPGLDDSFLHSFMKDYPNVELVKGKTYDVLMNADAALVTSGTATLETALFGIPEVVCYKGSAISYMIAKRLIHVKYISLVNLIMDKPVVKELIQDDLNTENLRTELTRLLKDDIRRAELKKDYSELYTLLSKGGFASAAAASQVVSLIR
ncbi:lipid-A-disaccharide synthase [Pollutibacter soli]|uniref:lipid-A-disaccharide synthase n=1 Tax=Pollutibacter soli TaxID=3034157 RepID=UPI003013D61A